MSSSSPVPKKDQALSLSAGVAADATKKRNTIEIPAVSTSSSSTTTTTASRAPAAKKLKTTTGGLLSPSGGATAPPVTDKASRGLRHFSMKVCRKVEEKGQTTYNEVADELVQEVLEERGASQGKYDEKNIRRRVYDALNVLMAMDIISKEKKDIFWKGLPQNCLDDLDSLRKEGRTRQQQVEKKREHLRNLIVQQVCFRNLVAYNQKAQKTLPAPTPAKTTPTQIPLPFILVNTSEDANIQCEISPDRTDVLLESDQPFEISDDNIILMRLGMNKINFSSLQEMLPKDLLEYCNKHDLLKSVIVDGDEPPKVGPPDTYPSVQQGEVVQ